MLACSPCSCADGTPIAALNPSSRYADCEYPGPLTWFYLFYIISLFVLFDRFSKRTYADKKANQD
jgi:hypothetical protein